MNRYFFMTLFLASAAAALFWADWIGYFKTPKNPVAKISSVEGVVKRMERGSLTWDRCFVGTVLEEGDTILTGSNGRAEITINSGGKLTVDESSMIVLSSGAEDIQVNIIAGRGEVKDEMEVTKKVKIIQKSRVVLSPKSVLEDRPSETVKKELVPKLSLVPQTKVSEIKPVRAVENQPFVQIGGGYRTLFIDDAPQLDIENGERFEIVLSPKDGGGVSKRFITAKTKIWVGAIAPGRYNWIVRIKGSKSRNIASTIGLRVLRDQVDGSAPVLKPVKLESLKPKLNPVSVENRGSK